MIAVGQLREPYREELVLDGRSAPLAAILTVPASPARDRPALILLNAGILHKIGPNRMTVRLAREAAARGLAAVRLDFAGIGDSPARSDGRPVPEGVLVDVRELMSHLERTRGIERFIVVGLCSGADNALRVARLDERVAGVCMLDPTVQRTRRWYVEHLGPRIAAWETWRRVLALDHPRIVAARETIRRFIARAPEETFIGPEHFRTGFSNRSLMEAHLRDVLARRVHLFVAFSGGWYQLYNYRTQLLDVFPDLDFGDLLRLEFYPQARHTFDAESHRALLLGDILDWAAGTDFAQASRPRR